jgi:hypothetical protein
MPLPQAGLAEADKYRFEPRRFSHWRAMAAAGYHVLVTLRVTHGLTLRVTHALTRSVRST